TPFRSGPDGNNYNPNATQPVRRFQWWGWLTTIGGYISGNGYVWQFVDPIWQQHLETQGAQDMMRLNEFIKSLEWWKLVPGGLDGMKDIIVDPANADTTASFVSDRKSTRLNSSHVKISYAVFCLKKKRRYPARR